MIYRADAALDVNIVRTLPVACRMHMRQLLSHWSVRALPNRARVFCLQCRSIQTRHMNASRASADSTTFHILAPLEQSTRRLAAILAEDARRGDCICLHGDVGAGKSIFRWCLSRASRAKYTVTIVACAVLLMPPAWTTPYMCS